MGYRLMHAAALAWVAKFAPTSGPLRILDVGGRDINGHPGDLFHPQSTWEVVDLVDGPRVTHVGDILDYGTVDYFDAALCLEVAEHTPEWPDIIRHISHLLNPDRGVLIFTAAGAGRAPHSAVDGGELRPGEHYDNIGRQALTDALDRSFGEYIVDVSGPDIRATAWR